MWRGFRRQWKMYIVKNHAWISKMFLKMFIFPWTFEVASQSYRSTTGNKKAENWLFFFCLMHTPPQGVCSAFHKITGTIMSFICIKGTGQTGLMVGALLGAELSQPILAFFLSHSLFSLFPPWSSWGCALGLLSHVCIVVPNWLFSSLHHVFRLFWLPFVQSG